MIGNFGLLNISLSRYIISNHQFLSQDMYKIIFVCLFRLCTQFYNNDFIINLYSVLLKIDFMKQQNIKGGFPR
jgi:hypothetical protein